MDKLRVIILGASGFVGRNLLEVLRQEESIEVLPGSSTGKAGHIHLDILSTHTWTNLDGLGPGILIDASGYGVVKHEQDLQLLYDINYLKKLEFYDWVVERHPELFWIQIGTAFEYQLDKVALTESTPCLPKTHYGISKAMFSQYLLENKHRRFTILRPFGMFGEGEDKTKFFPMLLTAQKNKEKINLSDGLQSRDYMYVRDLASFICHKITSGSLYQLEGEVLNLGSGNYSTLRELAEMFARELPFFDEDLWNWGSIPQRSGENSKFYNASKKAESIGFAQSDMREAIRNTIQYYYTTN